MHRFQLIIQCFPSEDVFGNLPKHRVMQLFEIIDNVSSLLIIPFLRTEFQFITPPISLFALTVRPKTEPVESQCFKVVQR